MRVHTCVVDIGCMWSQRLMLAVFLNCFPTLLFETGSLTDWLGRLLARPGSPSPSQHCPSSTLQRATLLTGLLHSQVHFLHAASCLLSPPLLPVPTYHTWTSLYMSETGLHCVSQKTNPHNKQDSLRA